MPISVSAREKRLTNILMINRVFIVRDEGIGPPTLYTSSRCSTTELIALFAVQSKLNLSFNLMNIIFCCMKLALLSLNRLRLC